MSYTLANIFLCHHEENWLNNCPIAYKPIFYRRYMDDTYMLFNEHSHINQFLTYLNFQHPNIKFTSELENDGKISFLDCTVERVDNLLTTSVYRKSTFTGQGLSYFSFCAKSIKLIALKRSSTVHTGFAPLLQH